MKKSRIKRASATVAVPQTDEEASQFIAAIGEAQRERESIQTSMNAMLARVKEQEEARARPFAQRIEELALGLQIYCDANRQKLTDRNRVKFHRFAAGEVSWRLRPRSVFIRKIEDVLHNLHVLGLERFIRVKEEINKEAMLADPVTANQVVGVHIMNPGEEFVVKPFATALEEVGSTGYERVPDAGAAAS
jgi:phage host-nuclease inhibitor protein Gam